MHQHTPPRRPAFTLTDLLAVLVVAVVLCAFTLPSCTPSNPALPAQATTGDTPAAQPQSKPSPDNQEAAAPAPLLPGRRVARIAASLNNLKQLATASEAYATDYKNYRPITPSYVRGSGPHNNAGTALEGWATWSAGGKNNHAHWAGKPFDIEAADRPLNPYVYADPISAPAAPATLAAADKDRGALELKVYCDPSDAAGHQRAWPSANSPAGKPVSCYDDVGTSYLWCPLPLFQLDNIANERTRFGFFAKRLQMADAFNPARFVAFSDEWLTLVAPSADRAIKLTNGHGDANKSAIAFFDGHAAYSAVFPGGPAVPREDAENPLENLYYSAVFIDLALPAKIDGNPNTRSFAR